MVVRRWCRRGGLVATAALLWLAAGCSSDGGDGGGGGGGAIDTDFDFGEAGVQPGVDSRDPGRGRLRGTLTDDVGDPAAGVRVTLYRLNASRQVGSTFTSSGSDGSYVFGNVPPGGYRLSADGRQQDVNAVANQDTVRDFSDVGGGTPGGDDQCEGEDDPTLPAPERAWTVIVYMNADNDLEPFGVDDINEMESLPPSDDLAIVVLMDRTRGFDTSNGNWTDARRFAIVADTDDREMTSALTPSEGGEAEVLGEIDMGNPNTLNEFVDWAMREYPAERYVVNIWNHGAGWRKRSRAAGGPIGRGISFDDSSNNGVGSNIETEEMSAALRAPACIDLLLMDCSLMQMMEVAYQVRHNAQFIVGSEESPPGEGYPYDQILRPLVDTPSTTAETLARHIVNATADEVGGRESITQSALRASQLENLRNAVDAFGQALETRLPAIEEDLAAARLDAQRYGGGSSLYEGNRDLIDFVDKITDRLPDANLNSAADAVRDAMNAALVAERHTGSTLADSNGLAIFAPNRADWFDLRTRYQRTAWAEDTQWDELWDAFHGVP